MRFAPILYGRPGGRAAGRTEEAKLLEETLLEETYVETDLPRDPIT